ncbi:hypothetical protein I2483_00895 [Sporosarcina sp. E16_3]|uniref:hypothetical protein n=1 Tax=unclassified Sporosarcina TaxID=2647733 RepID=UPI0016441660|nr:MULTISPECIES: hypothetical protein [unclassified Sporosarcina]MBO0600206.1 hypothetical protein [Sporosarcina sp. E16_3]
MSDVETIANEIIMIKNQQLLYKDSVENICATLDGHVFETTIPYQQMESFRKQYVLLSEKQDQGLMVIHFIHKGKVEANWLHLSAQ